jgi:hypothetical protein
MRRTGLGRMLLELRLVVLLTPLNAPTSEPVRVEA